MKVLVIGGAGFLGANLVRRCLAERGIAVTALDNLHPRFGSTQDALSDVGDAIEFVEADILDPDVLKRHVKRKDIVFHCAAQSSHPFSVVAPFEDARVNCLGSLRVLEAVRAEAPGAVVVYPSSSTVIGPARGIVTEDHRKTPLDVYSADKAAVEGYCRVYRRVYEIRTAVVRLPNLYGPFGKASPEFGFINHFIHQAWRNGTISIFGKGDQKRNVLYVEDAADALWRASQTEAALGEPFFATGDEHLPVREIAVRIVERLGKGRLVHVDWPDDRRKIEVGNLQLSSERFRHLTGWRPTIGFDEGLDRTRAVLENDERETLR